MACAIYITMDWLLILKTGMCTVDIWHKYVHYIVMYLTWVAFWWCPWLVVWEEGCDQLVIFCESAESISWICSWHCYVYSVFRRQVCLVVLVWIIFDFYHISLNLSIYPGYVRDIVMCITSLEDRNVGGSCVKLWSILLCT